MNPSNHKFRTIALTLLIAVALVLPVSAPSNWYNPEREDHDVNHGVDTVKSMAVTNSEDYYSNTSGHCAIGQTGGNTSRVFYQWYIANRRFVINDAPEGAPFRNNQSLYEYTWGNITESEVLYLNFDEGEGSKVYDKSGICRIIDIANVKLEICKANLQANSPTVNFLFAINHVPEGTSFSSYMRIPARNSHKGNDDRMDLTSKNKEFNQDQGGDF